MKRLSLASVIHFIKYRTNSVNAFLRHFRNFFMSEYRRFLRYSLFLWDGVNRIY
jgi:hypothetical protein